MTQQASLRQKALYIGAVAALALYLGGAVAACASAASDATPVPASTEAPNPDYFHDIVHKAQCWSIEGTGISCIPDSQLQ